MNTYETTATVEDHGQIRVAGVPFEPGTEVAVTVRQRTAAEANAETEKLQQARARMLELFTRLRGRNTEPIGPLNREGLYDRAVFR